MKFQSFFNNTNTCYLKTDLMMFTIYYAMVLEHAIYPYRILELVPSFQERPQMAVQPQPKQALVQLFESTSFHEDSPPSIVDPIEILSHNSRLLVNLCIHYIINKQRNKIVVEKKKKKRKKDFIPV